MGPHAPKRTEVLEGLEDYVKDAIISEASDDLVLMQLVELVLEETESRKAFPNLMDEPVLFRKFATWVREGLREAERAREIEQGVRNKITGKSE